MARSRHQRKKNRGQNDVVKTDSLPTAARQQALNERVVLQNELWFAGPLPHPGMLKAYDEVIPGLGERIVSQFERQTEHRQDLERQSLSAGILLAKRGQIIALCISGSVILIAAGLLYVDKTVGGLVALVTALTPLIVSFLEGRKHQDATGQQLTETVK